MNLEQHPASIIRKAAERRRLNSDGKGGEHPTRGAATTDDSDETASATDALAVALERLPRELAEVIEADPKLTDSWVNGTKLTKGDKTSPKALEYSLLHYLAWRDHGDELIEAAVRHYPHGEIGSGKLTGGNADRRIARMLDDAETVRERAQRRRESEAWYHELLKNREEEPRDCLANGALILGKDPAFEGRVRFDEHRGAVVCHDLPWRPVGTWREWTNIDDLRFAQWCQLHGVPLRPTTCADAVAAVADEHRFHPIRDWLDGLVWDGKKRLDGWLAAYLGVTTGDATYVEAVGRAWPISAAARVYNPGCKADHALILEGPQGAGKSSALAALVPNPEWFADEISDLGSKDSAQDLRGKWLIELAELSALRRGEIERTKAFMTRSVDHYRPSYGRRSQDFPRQCVFGGSTNADAYFGDETGNRRFWPVKVGTIDLAALRRDRDQLWAEAVAAYRAGEVWWLDRATEAAAAEEQAERHIADPWEAPLLEWAGRQVEPVGIPEALRALGVDTERHDQAAANRVARIFRGAGWGKAQRRVAGVRAWVYRLPSQVVDPASQLPSAPTCDEKASNGAPVTGVTGVTGRFDTRKEGPPTRWPMDFNEDGWVPREKLSGNGCDTCDTPPPPRRHDPRDEPFWLDQWKAARKSDQQNEVVTDWTLSAGGRTTAAGETLVSEIPAAFIGCSIARFATRNGWLVRGMRQ